MTFEFSTTEFWEGVITLIGTMAGLIFSFSRMVLRMFREQIETQLKAQTELLKSTDSAIEERLLDLRRQFDEQHRESRDALERELRVLHLGLNDQEKAVLRLRAELPTEYVRREDWIRFTGVIEAKIDALRASIDSIRDWRVSNA